MIVWQRGRVDVPGGHIAFHRTGGGGPALVLSHGLTDNGLCWHRLAVALASDFDIVMLDARGHGESSRILQDMDYEPSDDIAEVIDRLELVSPIVMGHSVGARATASYSNSHPDRVSKVVLEDPPFLPLIDEKAASRRREMFRSQVEKFGAMSEDELIAWGKATSPTWHEEDFPAWAVAKKQVDPKAMPVYRQPWQETIINITAPTLLIHGDPELGSLVTADIADEVVSLNRNINTVMIGGAGHNTRRENFQDYVSVVREFLMTDQTAV